MISLACLLLLVAQPQAPPTGGFPFFEPVRPPRPLQVMAHRGAAGLAPENTARALEASVADTVEWAEVDVRLTRDGHHVLFHDAELDGKTDATGRVRDRTLAEVRSADAGSKFAPRFAGERIPTLEEGLRLARGRINLYLDCKEVDPARLAREVLAARMGRQVVVYASPDVLRAVRAVAGEGVGLMTKWRAAFGVTGWIEEVRPHAVEIDAADVTAAACAEFHRAGIKVQARTLGDDDRPEVWDRVDAAGVDWIQTDRAEEVLARRALKAIVPGRVRVAHHRGASRYAPENTLGSLRKAVALGADLVEFDVRTTRDGAFVLLHDGSLDRTTSGRGPVRAHTAAEVATLDAGSWFGRPFAGTRVPSLDAFLDAARPTGVWLYVDAKDIAPEALAAILSRHGLSDRAVVYQGVAYLEELRSVAPTLRRMPPLADPSQLEAIAARVRPYAVDARWRILSKPLIDRCHSLGIKVFSDAIGGNESVESYQEAIRDGLDLIQTDHPVRVLRALEMLEHPAATVHPRPATDQAARRTHEARPGRHRSHDSKDGMLVGSCGGEAPGPRSPASGHPPRGARRGGRPIGHPDRRGDRRGVEAPFSRSKAGRDARGKRRAGHGPPARRPIPRPHECPGRRGAPRPRRSAGTIPIAPRPPSVPPPRSRARWPPGPPSGRTSRASAGAGPRGPPRPPPRPARRDRSSRRGAGS